MTRASEGMPSAIRRPGAFTGLHRRAIRASKVKVDMGTDEGLIAALKSPNIATQDAARRRLIERVKLESDPTSAQSAALPQVASRMGSALEAGGAGQQRHRSGTSRLDALRNCRRCSASPIRGRSSF